MIGYAFSESILGLVGGERLPSRGRSSEVREGFSEECRRQFFREVSLGQKSRVDRHSLRCQLCAFALNRLDVPRAGIFIDLKRSHLATSKLCERQIVNDF